MIIRIQGTVTDINIRQGKTDSGREWSRKVYTITDEYKDETKRRSVEVNDFGRSNQYIPGDPVFEYKSNHIVGEHVDIACFIETNKNGFTNVDYGMPWEDIDVKRDKNTNVVRPDAEQPVEQPQATNANNNGTLPF